MTRKVIDIAMVCFLVCFLFVGFAAGQASHKDEKNDRSLMPRKGIAVTVLNVPNYTLIELEGKGGRIWIAAPTVKVEVGEKVWAPKGIEMRKFYSEALERTFPVIHFVGRAETEGKESKETAKKGIEGAKTATSPAKGSIVKAKGGYTLKEIFDKKEKLGGKKVVFRGKVVKASGRIMGKRWFHLQDGTGTSGNLDLVVTSGNDAAAGDIVLVTGVLRLGKDLGQGYKYDVILEDAEIKADVIERSKTSAAPVRGSIAKAKGGYTLEEIFSKKEKLEGKKVTVRGKVVKASAKKIMNKRWIHLQDGTGSSGNLDLVMTSDDDVDTGDIVLATGVLGLGKEFGPNYKYDVILENVKIAVE